MDCNLREWRTGITQRQAAIKLGISLRTYCRWEAEGVPIGLQEVVRLALTAPELCRAWELTARK